MGPGRRKSGHKRISPQVMLGLGPLLFSLLPGHHEVSSFALHTFMPQCLVSLRAQNNSHLPQTETSETRRQNKIFFLLCSFISAALSQQQKADFRKKKVKPLVLSHISSFPFWVLCLTSYVCLVPSPALRVLCATTEPKAADLLLGLTFLNPRARSPPPVMF